LLYRLASALADLTLDVRVAKVATLGRRVVDVFYVRNADGAKIDVDQEQELAQAFAIRSVPSLLIIREQILVARESGALPLHELESVVEQAMLIDMDDLRQEMAAMEGDCDAIDH
jgi:thioredoxin-like negative regulator of GroEL